MRTKRALLGLLTLGVAFAATHVRAQSDAPMRVGAVLVRLEQFHEMRDGTVEAQLSFRNPADAPQAALALAHGDERSAHALRLSNAQGVSYRLKELSRFGDTGGENEWIALSSGDSAFVTATFAPDGAVRGVQPFALTVPVRLSSADDPSTGRMRTFDINFRGLHRDVVDEPPPPRAAKRAPVTPLPQQQMAALPPSAAPSVPAASPRASAAPVRAEDDLAPLVARLPAARQDSRRYLFAVGVEQYDDAPAVPFAEHSARTMAELLGKLYGVPEENATLITGADATGMKILGRLNSLIQRLTPGDTVYFYYAGHGLSARDGSAVYMVPKDAVPGAYEVEMLSLSSLLRRFEDSSASRVVAFIDTCFSGRVSQRESLFPGVSPLVPEPIEAGNGSRKTTLFLAGQSYQFANDYPEHGYRLFSYYVMRGLLEGNDDPERLEAFVAHEVRRVSSKRGAEFLQEPQLQGSVLSLASAYPARP